MAFQTLLAAAVFDTSFVCVKLSLRLLNLYLIYNFHNFFSQVFVILILSFKYNIILIHVVMCFCCDFGLDFFSLSNLTLVSEWKEMVTRLILMSYSLSAVVSPVVQSSSPEGLIPMDSDPGKEPKRIPKELFSNLMLLKVSFFVLHSFRTRPSTPPFQLLVLCHNFRSLF